MTDALHWLAALLLYDLARVVGGILLLASIIELVHRFREWLL